MAAHIDRKGSDSSPSEVLGEFKIALFKMPGAVTDEQRGGRACAIRQKEFANEFEPVRRKAYRFGRNHAPLQSFGNANPCRQCLGRFVRLMQAISLGRESAKFAG
jgi:hypothetical protein